MSTKQFHRPTDLAAAVELLSRTDEHIVPTLVRPRMPVEPYADADAIVDLSRLKLSYITEDEAGIHIGALTPLQDIAQSELLKGIANGIVSEAAELAAHLGLRNIATLGGALAGGAQAAADGPQELRLALDGADARAVMYESQQPEVSLASYGTSSSQFLIEVKLSRPITRTGGALERVARTPRDESIVAVIAVVSRLRWRVMVGPAPLHGLDILRGLDAPDFAAIAVSLTHDYNPPSDFRASAEYRKAMAGVLARRVLEKAWQRASQ